MHSMTLLSLWFASCYIVALGNGFIDMSSGIKLPSLPQSTLYSIFVPFCLLEVSIFAIRPVIWLLKLRDIIFTISICQSFQSSEFCQLSSPLCCILFMALFLCIWNLSVFVALSIYTSIMVCILQLPSII